MVIRLMVELASVEFKHGMIPRDEEDTHFRHRLSCATTFFHPSTTLHPIAYLVLPPPRHRRPFFSAPPAISPNAALVLFDSLGNQEDAGGW